MSEHKRPQLRSFPSHDSSSSDFQDNKPESSDWGGHHYAQASFPPPPSFIDPIPNVPGTPSSVSHAVEGSLNPKVAIPRAVNSTYEPSTGRVGRACLKCRAQKTKCSGETPCQKCQESGSLCSYGEKKKDVVKRQINDLTAQVKAYEQLLRDVCPKLDPQYAQRVEQILAKNQADLKSQLFPSLHSPTSSPLMTHVSGPSGLANSSSYSSLGVIDHTDEDFNRDERVQATGFIGEPSAVAWIYGLKRELEQSLDLFEDVKSNTFRESFDRESIASVNYFLDDMGAFVLEDVDVFQRPPQVLADRLVDIYFQAVHPYFPIIGKMTFLQQYTSFYIQSGRPGKRWLAIINLVFAIAAKYSHLVLENSGSTQNDHVLFFSRAWRLSLSSTALLDHPNLQQVQVEGLASFYLLSIGQTNRSWRICGISIRSAATMGLNLRSESSTVVHVSKEIRYRVWWALFTLDSLLCAMTGRPPSTSDAFCTTPLPVPFDEEDFRDKTVAQLIIDQKARSIFMDNLSSNGSSRSTRAPTVDPETLASLSTLGKTCEQIASSASECLQLNISLFFLYYVKLGLIMREAVDTLYAPGAAWPSWNDIEADISKLNGKAESWLLNLPTAFKFTEHQETQSFERQRLNLAFSFFSAKMIILQPCLRRLTRQPHEPLSPGNFRDVMATLCVDSASQMINLLPDEPDMLWLYHYAPWSCILHYLMQCMTVLLAELLTRAQPGAEDHRRLLTEARKGMAWLHRMGAKDSSSQRAWLVCKELFSRYDPDFWTKDEMSL